MEYKNKFIFEEVKAHWNKVAHRYDHHNDNKCNPHKWRFIEGIKHLEQTEKKVKVLNLESRTGDAIPYIRSKLPNAKIYNAEFADKMIKIAKKRFPKEIFMETDLEKVNLPSNHVDYIMSPETFEHVPNPTRLIEEFYRVLKSNGKLILSLPPRIADIHQKVYEIFVGSHGDGSRKSIWSFTMKRILRDAGFKIELHKSILLFPIGSIWIIEFGNKLLKWFPFIRELGIMQFYICTKFNKDGEAK